MNEMIVNEVETGVSYSIEDNSDYGIILRVDLPAVSTKNGVFKGMHGIIVIKSGFYTCGTKQYIRSTFIDEKIGMVFMDIFKKYNLDVQYNGLYFVMTQDVYDKLEFLVKTYDRKLV